MNEKQKKVLDRVNELILERIKNGENVLVKKYTKEMRATLLLPAGITSEASIHYKDEAELLDAADDVDKVYVEQVLPAKMKYNLESIRKFSFWSEIVTMIRTVLAVIL